MSFRQVFTPSIVNLGIYRILKIERIATTRNRPQNEEEHTTRTIALEKQRAELKELKNSMLKKEEFISWRLNPTRPEVRGIPGNNGMLHSHGRTTKQDPFSLSHFQNRETVVDPHLSFTEQHFAFYAALPHKPIKTRQEVTFCAGHIDNTNYKAAWKSDQKVHSRRHPRIYIRVKPGTIAICKYCQTFYVLVDENGDPVPACQPRPAGYKRQHVFDMLDDPARHREDFLGQKGRYTLETAQWITDTRQMMNERRREMREASPYGEGPEHQPFNHVRPLTHEVDAYTAWVRVPRPADAPDDEFID
eukprot:TRINITY_DN58555_c0_g1_i1.p1 TRINITY_DN58555_c0_g1~~TRINITY_DN58555_c0_g1_i1.p1  ORF type:complete len:304 (+),score=29.49 TRINITY_DN58555_c0_g1_i1:118-1029(+)